ncbi:MAG TPA: TonB-dependent receptor [Gemmatimonadales bacterium]|nr:TonB-dependent receptor [Gemmatimonadales bacterium]
MRRLDRLATLLAAAAITLARPAHSLAQRPAQQPAPGAIEGVVSGPTGAVSDAEVVLDRTVAAARTDSTGHFRIENVAPGSYRLSVNAIGLAPVQTKVQVTAGESAHVDVALARAVQRLADLSVTTDAPARRRPEHAVGRMDDVSGGAIYAGKKTEVLALDSLDVNAAQNVSRQILGRVPGLTVAETEGAGFPSNGIGFRGLNPTQSVEVNVRQDGYNIAADPYGYPETYFLPPAEALDRVELVRGASSLDFGSQFGGMVNYVIRDGVPGPPEIRTRLTGGSFETLNGFADVGGGAGSVTYYGFLQARTQDGWRPNNSTRQITGFGRIRWRPSHNWRLGAEYTLFRNRIRMPGGLTNAEFAADPRSSFRFRNWLGSPWNILALTADYSPNPNLTLHTTAWGNLSQRYLVWRNEDGGAGAVDAVDPSTGQFVPREVERERFTNATLESRLAYSFPLLGRTGTFAAGVRAFTGRMHRQSGGPGSTGSDFDLGLYGGPFEKDIQFYNTNLAAHVEQLVRLGERVTVTPGIRFEYLRSSATGYTDTTFSGLARSRTFALPGVAAEVRTTPTTSLYGSISRSYRPIEYSSLTPFATVSRIDPNLHDASGMTADLGWRGTLGSLLRFDVGLFRIEYGDRIGLVSATDPDGTPFTLRTNVATSVHRGVESYIELSPIAELSLFDAFAFTDARYVEGEFAGNRVEYAPKYVNRVGARYARGSASGAVQLSTVSQAFGDANNTIGGNDANVGLVPAYALLDVSGQMRVGPRYTLGAGVNNLTDERYFTRRTDEYPGPGILPSPGRSFYLTIGADF